MIRTMDRAPLHRRILTAPMRWHNRFEAWLDEQHPESFFAHADLVSEFGLIAVLIILVALIGIGAVLHIHKAR